MQTSAASPRVGGAEYVRRLSHHLRLMFPAELQHLLAEDLPEPLGQIIYGVDPFSKERPNVAWALGTLQALSSQPVPKNLIPIHAMDDRSFACVVCQPLGEGEPDDYGRVVRWHLDGVASRAQRQALDTSAAEYVRTVEVQEIARRQGLERFTDLVAMYEASHPSGSRPKLHELRPIRIAVQNVVLALAAWRYESAFDGLAVTHWITTQASHVAAHEGTRALTALMLAEAFRSGGTMEIRFDHHPEGRVPASLRQYARVLDLPVGEDDPKSISPSEARALMLAVTRMPGELGNRVKRLVDVGSVTAERACFTLLSGTFQPIELDWLAAASQRAPQLLLGGSDVLARPSRQVELEVGATALMVGSFFGRLSQPLEGTTRTVRVLEDERLAVSWSVRRGRYAIEFRGLPPGPIPWHFAGPKEIGSRVVILPRMHPDELEVDHMKRLAGRHGTVHLALLVPVDVVRTHERGLDFPLTTLACPETTGALERALETRLLTLRMARA